MLIPTMMQQPKIIVQPRSLPEILNEMATGTLQVPRFQRDFVWPLTKTRELLDSMYKEFPIGTFFLWRAPVGSPPLSRPLTELSIPMPPPGAGIIYILDGQQRLTSLFVTINGLSLGSRNYGRISLDLETATQYEAIKEEGFEEDIFVYHSGDNQRYIAVHDLVGPDHLQIYNQIQDVWKPAFNKAYKLFHSYPFSVVWIQEQTLADAIVIFQRINQAGKPLSRYDLICANVWTQNFDFRKRVETLNRQFDHQGFGRLHETVFTQTFALILKDQCTTAAELSLTTDDILSVWDCTIRALQLAVDFALNNLGVKRAEYLPYRGILPVLAYYFYHAPHSAISAQERQILWSWFWRVTLSERYSSTSPSRMAEDAQKLRKLLDGEIPTFDYVSRVTPDSVMRTRMTSTTSALRNAVICLLALKQPQNFKDGSPVNLSDPFFSNLKTAERHHIFPIGYLKQHNISQTLVHLVPNFCFIPSDLNSEIGRRAPSDYLTQYHNTNPDFASAAGTHLLPIITDAALWKNDYNGFLYERATLIAEELNRLVGSTPSDFIQPVVVESGKSAIEAQVDALEIRLRDLVDHRLTAVIGVHYWSPTMPGEVITYTKERIQQHLAKHSYEDWSDYPPGRARLEFCTPAHYYQIFHNNWKQFSEIFGSEPTLERYLSDYNALRNALKHNRETSDLELESGRIAVKWLERILTKYDEEHRIEEEDNGDEFPDTE